MTNGLTIKRRFRVVRQERGRKAVTQVIGQRHVPACVPRISRLMALAIRFDQLIGNGDVTDQAELARVGYVTRARLTQIMDLLSLAPNIQDEILYLCGTDEGRDRISERRLRPIVAELSWRKQRRMWDELSQAAGAVISHTHSSSL